MGIFSVTEIPPLMYVCGERMKKLSKLLFDNSEGKLKEKYISDCDKNDARGINHGLDHGLCRLLHSQSVKEGLIDFAKKFTELNIDLDDEFFEKNLIVKIAGYSDQMLRIIDENCNSDS